MDESPLIMVSQGGAIQGSYQCDCACAQQNPSRTSQQSSQSNSTLFQRSMQLTFVPVDAVHEIIYHQTQMVGPVLVNQSARAVLDFFTSPNP